jgi:hypothetical protein
MENVSGAPAGSLLLEIQNDRARWKCDLRCGVSDGECMLVWDIYRSDDGVARQKIDLKGGN